MILTCFAIAGTGLVALTFTGTRDIIIANEREALLTSLSDLVPPERYDNAVTEDTIQARDPELLGIPEPITIYRAYQGNQPVALFATPVAPDGYSGPIKLLVGVYADGTLAGVRAISHKETPGLGDAIDSNRSDWIRTFTGRSLNDPPPDRWQVKKDGGDFDQLTGATVTPRAIVKAAHNFLIYFARHREHLFTARPKAATEDST
jgi:electron transport complex protein RnfG